MWSIVKKSQARVDGRTRLARQFCDLCAELSGRLGSDRQDDVLTRTAIHRAASLILAAETLTSSIAAGVPADAGELVLVTDACGPQPWRAWSGPCHFQSRGIEDEYPISHGPEMTRRKRPSNGRRCSSRSPGAALSNSMASTISLPPNGQPVTAAHKAH